MRTRKTCRWSSWKHRHKNHRPRWMMPWSKGWDRFIQRSVRQSWWLSVRHKTIF